MSSRAPRPPSPPCSVAIAAPLLVDLGALPGRVPQVVLQLAYLALVLEGGRKRRKKEGKEEGREGGKKAPTSHRRNPESTELEELNFLTLTLCTAHS